MIYDDFANFDRYRMVAPTVWDKVKSFLIKVSQASSSGRFPIAGDDCFANVTVYNTKELDPDKLEVHEEYLDVQIAFRGRELIYCRDLAGCAEVVPYSAEKDIAFYRMEPDNVTELVIGGGKFAVLYPGEGHLPGCDEVVGESKEVLKVIVKIRRGLLG